jgi:hypothetical protein
MWQNINSSMGWLQPIQRPRMLVDDLMANYDHFETKMKTRLSGQ